MNVSQSMNTIATMLEDDFEVVQNPDHPFLFLGPDLLVGTRDHIVGIFLVHYDELTHPEELLARMAMSRIGYPDNFQAVLIFHQSLGDDDPFNKSVRSQFDAVVDSSSVSTIKKRLRDGIISSINTQSLPVQRQSTFDQADVLYSESLKDMAHSTELPEAPVELAGVPELTQASIDLHPWLKASSSIRRAHQSFFQIFEFGEVRVASISLQQRSQVRRKLTRFGRRMFTADHYLDNGIPYRHRQSNNVLFVDKRPKHRYDPDKWIRASAFAGFAMFQLADKDHVTDKLERLKKGMRSV